MNRIIYNYKMHVESVSDGRTFSGVVDLGFRLFNHSTFQLAGMELPDPRRCQDRDKAVDTLKRAEQVLASLLLHPDGHGRTIVISPHEPSKTGRVFVSAYIPCKNESFDHPHLTIRRAGFVLLNVLHVMQLVGESQFFPTTLSDLFGIFEPFDFDR